MNVPGRKQLLLYDFYPSKLILLVADRTTMLIARVVDHDRGLTAITPIDLAAHSDSTATLVGFQKPFYLGTERYSPALVGFDKKGK